MCASCLTRKRTSPSTNLFSKKLANYFIAFECESEFLSRKAAPEQLQDVLEQLYNGLTTTGQCNIQIDDANAIFLRLLPKLPPPPEVEPHQVPVRIRDLDALVSPDWDLTVQRVIPFIDGVRYVKKIAKDSNVQLQLVIQCMRHLLYYKCIAMIDIFQYANIYVCTPQIHLLAEHAGMQKECLKYITVPGSPPQSFEKIFSLYCSLRPGLLFYEFCQLNNITALNIDERRFVTFGLVNGILRRMHKYPLRCSSNPQAGPSNLPPHVDRLLDEKHSFDHICCELGCSPDEVAKYLAADTQSHYVIVYK